MNIEIKEMNKSDLEKIKNILQTDFDDFWSYNILKEEIGAENSKYVVAVANGEIVGFAGLKIVADQADIMNIVTRKNFRRKGVGTLLLKKLITICKDFKLTSIFLEVNEENIPAITLYEKFGFKNVGIRKNYYKNKNGIVMQYVIRKLEE